MLKWQNTQNPLWRLDVAAIYVQVVITGYFCSMQLRAADKKVNQTRGVQWETSVEYVFDQILVFSIHFDESE